MTLADLKILFRSKLKKVAGGPPVGTVGQNRTEGLWACLDAVAEFAASLTGGGDVLTAVFNAGSDNTQQLTLETTTTYTAQARTNVAAATLDGSALTLPVTLAAGTTYTLTITRTTAANGAVLTLSA